jgi:preprotein translocase SecE subunit
VARDRQAAKRRQAERRAARLREGRPDQGSHPRPDRPATSDGAATGGGAANRDGADRGSRRGAPSAATDGERAATGAAEPPATGMAEREPDPLAEAQIAAAAPPEDTGRSDTVVEAPPPAPDLGDDGDGADRERAADERKPERGRVAAFLVAVWAELQRVQWPNRRTLVTLTGVVLGFVVIMGAYLGGLDWLFSRLVQALL